MILHSTLRYCHFTILLRIAPKDTTIFCEHLQNPVDKFMIFVLLFFDTYISTCMCSLIIQYGTDNAVIERSPKLIPSLSGKGLKQISASVGHAAASDIVLPIKGDCNLKIPFGVPDQYCSLKDISCDAIHARLMLLNHFSKLFSQSWPLLSSVGKNKVHIVFVIIREYTSTPYSLYWINP